jgi:hypothetical protein
LRECAASGFLTYPKLGRYQLGGVVEAASEVTLVPYVLGQVFRN